MGNQSGRLDDVEVGEPLQLPSASSKLSSWSAVYLAQYKDLPATLFVWNLTNEAKAVDVEALKHGFNHLKQLRHPSILKCFDYAISGTEICLVTERVTPLTISLESESLLESVEITSGLHSLAESLLFLHEVAHMWHNNIGPQSVFVCPDGSWRLGGFELCSSKPANASEDPLESSDDISSFGELIEFLMPYVDDDVKVLLEELHQQLSAHQMNFTAVASSSLLQNELCCIQEFLKCIHMKEEMEKENFFQSLPSRLRLLPSTVCARRLTKLLLSRFVLLEPLANLHFLPKFLTPRLDEENEESVLPMEVFQRYVVPELVKIFLVHETSVRIALLNHFHRFCAAFELVILRKVILPEILLGLKDVNSDIVVASFHALANLVPLLGAEAVTGHSHRRIFSDGTPKHKTRVKSHAVYSPVELRFTETDNSNDAKMNGVVPTGLLRVPVNLQKQLSNGSIPSGRKASHPDETHLFASEPNETITDALVDEDELNSHVEAKESLSDDEDWGGWENTPENKPIASNGAIPSITATTSSTLPLLLPGNEVNLTTERKKSLGEEFEIKVDKTVVAEWAAEPDYFADMQPTVPKKSDWLEQMASSNSATVAAGQPVPLSPSKFKVSADVEETTGEWDVE